MQMHHYDHSKQIILPIQKCSVYFFIIHIPIRRKSFQELRSEKYALIEIICPNRNYLRNFECVFLLRKKFCLSLFMSCLHFRINFHLHRPYRLNRVLIFVWELTNYHFPCILCWQYFHPSSTFFGKRQVLSLLVD
jgi:hypothetical protein